MHLEAGERRDFLPDFVSFLERLGAKVVLEQDYGSGMGLSKEDYLSVAPKSGFASLEEVYNQDIILVLRYPGDEQVRRMRPGTCLMSMLHYPTRPHRVQFLRRLGIEAISLDSIKDDLGRRIVENLRSVGWNGAEAAFSLLAKIYPPPGIEDPTRNPIKVTVLGAGAVGMFAIQAAVRYGNEAVWQRMAGQGATGVQVTAVEYDLTNHPSIMTQILKYTDILIDATQRPDPGKPIIPNSWIGVMRPHAILLDLSVDPYDCADDGTRIVKGIEGVPHGNLDQYVFAPDDPAFSAIPACIDTGNRRWSISCYSWPGIHPEDCMKVYGKQIEPLFQTLIEVGGVGHIRPDGSFFQRALSAASLSNWAG